MDNLNIPKRRDSNTLKKLEDGVCMIVDKKVIIALENCGPGKAGKVMKELIKWCKKDNNYEPNLYDYANFKQYPFGLVLFFRF